MRLPLNPENTILYIDDEQANLDGFKFNFRKDYNIFLATNTQEAFEIIEKNKVKVVLSDNRMPDMLGTEFFEIISKSHPDIIRILVTAYADSDAVMQAINKGQVYRFITKPWNKNELQVTIDNAFEAYDLKHHNMLLIDNLTKQNKELDALNVRLVNEIDERKKAQTELAEHRDNLEKLVQQRTEEIEKINTELALANYELIATNQELNAINEEIEVANQKLNHEIIIRTQVQDLLAESENKFRGMIEQSSEGIMLIDRNGLIVDCNKAVERIFETDSRDIVSTNAWDFDFRYFSDNEQTTDLHTTIQNNISNYIAKLESNTPRIVEGYRQTPSGRRMYINMVIFPIVTPKGKFLGRIIRDITEKVRADEELRKYKEELEVLVKERTNQLLESEQRLRTLSDNLPGGAIYRGYTDKDGRDFLIYASASIAKIGGFEVDAPLVSLEPFFSKIHPDDKELFYSKRLESQKSLQLFDIEIKFQKTEKEYVWFHLRTMFRMHTDGNIWWDGYVIDITDRKLAENAAKEYDNLINSIQEGIAAKTGEKLFESVVLKISESLKADLTYIAEIPEKEQHKIRTLSLCSEGKILDNISYNSKNTPCADVIEKQCVAVASGIQTIYPNQPILKHNNINGYVGVPLFDSHQNPIGIMVTMFSKPVADVKLAQQILEIFSSRVGAELERRKSELALKEREERFRTLFELSPNISLIIDNEGVVLEANSAFIEMSGYSRRELVNKSMYKLNIWDVADWGKAMKQYEKKHKVRNYELKFTSKNVELHYALLSLEPFFVEGESLILITATDITERKKAEEAIQQYSDIANNMQVALNVFHLDDPENNESLVLVKANPAAQRIMGYKVHEVLGKRFNQIYPHLRGYGLDDIFANIIRTGIPYENEEFKFFSDSGSILFFTAKAFRVPNNCVGVLFEDITRRKRVEKAVIENEERYRALFEKSPYGIHLLSTNGETAGKFISVNSKVAEMLGYTNRELIGMPFDKITKELTQADRINISERLMKGENVVFETSFSKFDGSSIPVEVTASTINLGEELLILGIDRDITEIKEAERKLKESVQFLSTLVETIPLPVFYKDTKGVYLGCNSIFESYTGYSRNHLIGKTAKELYPEQYAKTYIEADNELFKKNTTQRYEGQMLYADGSLRDIIFNKASFTDAEGNILGLIGAMFDITDRKKSEQFVKESEQKLLNIFNSSSDGIIITDYNFGLIDINNTLLNIFGFKNINEINFSPLDVVLPEYYPIITESFNKLVNEGAQTTLEVEALNSNGNIIPVEINSKIIEHGGQKAVLNIIRDITDRKDLEKKLFETIISTEEKERERFAGNLHDEVGPLLSSLKMYISLLAETEDKKKKEYIIPQIQTLIKESIQTVREISNDLSPHVLNNYGCVAAINSFLGMKRDFLNIEFNHNTENRRYNQNIEIVVYRIVKELINNTIKHAKASKVEIKLNDEDNILRLHFTDDGIGFDIESTAGNTKGSIGLLNIISRIKTVGGKYKMTSAKGSGFAFELTIPLKVKN